MALLLAVGEAGDPRGLEFLADVIAAEPEHADAATAQIQRVGASGDAALDEDLRARLRAGLDVERPERCRTICQALAALGDLPCVPRLIEFLAHDSAALRASAHAALERITGLVLPADRARWSHWYHDETAWMQRAKAEAFRRLSATDEAEVARALHDLASHPLARPELVDALHTLFASPRAGVRALACSAAGELAQLQIVPALIEQLEDPSSDVVQAAHRALCRLTGLELSDDPAPWRRRYQV